MSNPLSGVPRSWAGDLAVDTSAVADDAITNAKLANIARGSVKVGGTSNAPTDLDAKTSGQILVGDGTDIKSVAVSGDATLAAAGTVTLATAFRRNSINLTVPTVPTAAGTTEVLAIVPFSGTLTTVLATFKDALAAHDTNYLTFKIINKGQAGAGTTDLLAVSDANTTKITGGAAISGYTARVLTVHGTGANLVVNQNDTLAIQFIGAGTLANTLTEGTVHLRINPS